MRHLLCCFLLAILLTLPAAAAQVPKELQRAVPNEAEELMGDTDDLSVNALGTGLVELFKRAQEKVGAILRERLQGAVRILLVVLLCSLLDGFCRGTGGGEAAALIQVAGALSVAILAAGSMDSLIGLGADTLASMRDFSSVLLPVLAAATASAGAITTATVQQVATVFFTDLLLRLMDGLLVPLVYLYIGVVTASAMLPESGLSSLAEGLKKTVTWILSAVLIAFTVYLSAVRIIGGTADGAAVKVAKAAISGTIPVVGSILSEASETVMAGAGVLKGAIGIFGTLAVLSICILPFLQLGIQYLLYKLTAFLAGTVGAEKLCRLIEALGSAFGLVLGMTGAGALVLLVSILSSVSAVVA